MTAKAQIYKCDLCGNIVEVLDAGKGELVCCGEPMKLFEEKTADKSTEKHVPVIEKTPSGYKVTVGTTLHPMEEKHYIEWIELNADGVRYKKFLKPGDAPVAEFCINAEKVSAREYCNIHGLWKS
ncbi:MAG: desulfoferrodoxin [Spirochaetales bacterium]